MVFPEAAHRHPCFLHHQVQKAKSVSQLVINFWCGDNKENCMATYICADTLLDIMCNEISNVAFPFYIINV